MKGDYYRVAEAINEAFLKAYPHPELIHRTADPAILVKRVEMLLDDLECTRRNFHFTNLEVVRLDCKIRGIRQHWWQLWRRHG